MTQYNPLVTIVIPVYNGTNYMSEAIDCALSQTYKNVEIIVVNDGSTDNGATDAVARSYGDKIRYIWKENGGVSSALNLAIREMRGEWLSWLSHDDLYYPDKIEKQIRFLEKLRQEDSKIDLEMCVVHTATESIDKDGKIIKRPSYSGLPEKENTIDVILDNIYCYRLSGCSFLLPASCFKRVGGFREDIRTVSDVEMWYRLLFTGYQFYCMSNDILVKNRSHGKQVGKTKVSLFESELNRLHIDIADLMAADSRYNKVNNMQRLYYGLEKRGILEAAEYVKTKYLRNKVSALEYSIMIPAAAFVWRAVGNARTLARDIYRKINVK